MGWSRHTDELVVAPAERARRSILSGLQAMDGTGINMDTTTGNAASPDADAASTATVLKKDDRDAEDKGPAPAPPPAFPAAAAIVQEYEKHRAANLARNKQLLEELRITSEVEALTAGFMKPTPRRRGPNKPKEPITEVRRSGRLAKERY